MDLNIIKNALPKEIIDKGHFCFTARGEKKPRDAVTYVGIGANEIDKSFYDIENSKHLHYANCIGIKVGNGISAIDIDDCVIDGVISSMALDVIESVKSYTEFSPSGTGIRILFIANTRFDRNKWKIKNPVYKIEYYDADDQEANGGRMVRLSGVKLNDYGLKKVDTLDILNKYLVRDVTELATADDNPINMNKVRFISALLKRDPNFVSMFGRAFTGLSESDWDYALMSMYFSITTNKNEARFLFEKSNYFRTKSERHIKKWNNGYYANYLTNINFDPYNIHPHKKYVDLFDKYEPEEFDINENAADVLYLARKFKFIGRKFLSDIIVHEIDLEGQELLNACHYITSNHRQIEKLIYAAIRNE